MKTQTSLFICLLSFHSPWLWDRHFFTLLFYKVHLYNCMWRRHNVIKLELFGPVQTRVFTFRVTVIYEIFLSDSHNSFYSLDTRVLLRISKVRRCIYVYLIPAAVHYKVCCCWAIHSLKITLAEQDGNASYFLLLEFQCLFVALSLPTELETGVWRNEGVGTQGWRRQPES